MKFTKFKSNNPKSLNLFMIQWKYINGNEADCRSKLSDSINKAVTLVMSQKYAGIIS